MRIMLILVLALFGLGCKTSAPEPPAPPPPVAPAAPAGAPATGATLTGKVLEKLDAGPYSYLRLSTARGETWAAVPVAKIAVGAEVTVAKPMPMDGFKSKTLDRTFDKIVFGSLAGGGAGAALPMGHPAPGAAPAGMMGVGSMVAHPTAAPVADVGPIVVARAEGADGRTVAEVFGQKAKLKDKSVALRGKVVKVTNEVLGQNFVHIRDGSGGDGTHDNDITVTTKDSVGVGDVVLVRGTVRLDKDFGAGYAYPVIIENATLSK